MAADTATTSNVRDWLRTQYGLADDATITAANLELRNGRVWFPYQIAGETIYNGGRSINGLSPKYFYHQGKPRPPYYATPAADTAPIVAVCESQFDALVCLQAGTPAVAIGGSYPNEEALRILRAKEEVIIIPDNDKPGDDAAARLIEALDGDVKLRRARVPDGFKDISEFVARVAKDGSDPGEAVADLLDIAENAELELDFDFPLDWDEMRDNPPPPVEMW
jgi:DNA primase